VIEVVIQLPWWAPGAALAAVIAIAMVVFFAVTGRIIRREGEKRAESFRRQTFTEHETSALELTRPPLRLYRGYDD
jgi:hypothetical protein